MKWVILSWALRITIAIIFLQTLYFKFSAHPDSVHIFSALGLEPYGRIGLGVAELLVSLLVLWNRTRILGLILSLGIIAGAIISHLLVLGWNVQDDGGGLFLLALVVLIAAIGALFLHRVEFWTQVKQFKKES